jgi:MFS family permease
MLDLQPLRSASFRHLAAAYWVNEFGNWIGEIALTLLVYDRTHSPLSTAALFLSLRFLPALLAPLLTLRVETLPARALLTAMYLLEALFFAGLALLTHHFSLAAVFGLGALDGVLAVTAKALTRGATANGLLKRGLLREGNGILNLGAMASTAGSPVIAAALVAWKGAGLALQVDAVTFLLTAAIIATTPGLRIESEAEATFTARLKSGLSAASNNKPVEHLLSAIALVMVVSAVPIPIEVVFAKHTLHAGASGYGLLLGSWGVGMVIGGAVFASAREVRLMRLLAAGTLLNALGYGGLAISPTLAVACISSAVGGMGNGVAWVAAVTAIQERIPPNTQNGVMSVLEGLNQVMPAIGFVAGGVITAVSSPRIAYGVAAVGIAATVLGASRLALGRSPGIHLHPPDLPADKGDSRANKQEMRLSDKSLSLATFTTG